MVIFPEISVVIKLHIGVRYVSDSMKNHPRSDKHFHFRRVHNAFSSMVFVLQSPVSYINILIANKESWFSKTLISTLPFPFPFLLSNLPTPTLPSFLLPARDWPRSFSMLGKCSMIESHLSTPFLFWESSSLSKIFIPPNVFFFSLIK